MDLNRDNLVVLVVSRERVALLQRSLADLAKDLERRSSFFIRCIGIKVVFETSSDDRCLQRLGFCFDFNLTRLGFRFPDFDFDFD